MVVNDLMGHSPAKVDQKGRIKVPTAFRSIIEERFGNDCFITSFDGERAMVFPLPVWRELNARLSKVPSTSTSKRKFMERVNYYGQLGTIDAQGRLMIPQILRQVADLEGEVVVLGSGDHLIVWSDQKIAQRMSEEPLTEEDYKELELHGV
ncbi:MAG: division/cell wall cluster transcriptional repressor MraZ [Thermoanaerobaculia bacterium]|nr:division/cell wall cluster transcriptional repressor MraZ [Thermoanaerobaculia bacterium]